MQNIVIKNIKNKINYVARLIVEAKKENSEFLLREAIRAGYYVLFQSLSLFAVRNIITSENVNEEAWIKIFRSIDHKDLKNKLLDREVIAILGEAKNISHIFEKAQELRLKADYDPRIITISFDDFDKLFEDGLTELNRMNKLESIAKAAIATNLLFKKKDR